MIIDDLVYFYGLIGNEIQTPLLGLVILFSVVLAVRDGMARKP